MWGRHRDTAVSEQDVATTATAARAPQALSTVNDLRRRAEWEGLSDDQRTALRGEFAPFPASSAASGAAEPDIQQWVAALVTPTFQPEAAQAVTTWLSDTAPGAHLYVGGDVGLGRRSLAAALARQAMAQLPPTPDYVYIPQPAAMGKARLLTLPTGAAAAFSKAIDAALRLLTSSWDEAGEAADASSASDQQSANGAASAAPGADSAQGSQGSQGSHGSARAALVAQAFAPLDAPAFDYARAYLQELRAAFDALASAQADIPASYDDMPTWTVSAAAGVVADPVETPTHAPVVIGSLIRDKLDDLLIRANGGVLILPATDVIAADGAWISLSVALATRSLQIKSNWPALPLTVRVALFGDNDAYGALNNAAGEFSRIFRYETWLRPSTNWTQRSEAAYATLADGAARQYGLPPLDSAAVARLVEEGARRGDGLNRSYLVTDLLLLRDLAVEGARVAQARGAATTGAADMAQAFTRRRALQGAIARRVREAILSGQANTPTAGTAIGQINGLGIFSFHPAEGAFAVPTRISATVGPGREARLLDIEREAQQADADHVRGEMTIEGYLAYRYGQERPIRLTARVRFEQEHGATGGDSASGALLFALLSALARAPLSYSYAVTGAVGQYGELQPIGGVNTKIEGFWELCRLRRAQGEQAPNGYGVIIPAVNARDLMLRDEVAESIASEGWFRVWPVTSVDEALAILTGLPAAEVHARVERRLQQFHEASAQAGTGRS